MRKFVSLLAVLVAALLYPAAADAFTGVGVMNGDTCDTSQFSADEVVAASGSNASIGAVSSATDPAHVMQGKCSIQYHLNGKDTRVENRYGGTSGSTRNISNGQDVWLARWAYLDPVVWAQDGYNAGHHLTMQMKTIDASTGGPWAFDDRGVGGPCPSNTCWQFNPEEGGSAIIMSQPVVQGEWDGWLFHFVLSQSVTTGLIEVYKNGVLQFSEHHQTIDAAGNPDYYKQGIYQNNIGVVDPSTEWIDGTTLADTESAAEIGAWGVASKTPPRAFDSYTEASDVDLTAHAGEVGSTWVKHPSYTGSIAVNATNDSVRGNTTGGSGTYFSSTTPLSADQTVQGDIKQLSSAAGGWAGLTARESSTVGTMYTCLYYQPNNDWVLQKKLSGVNTTLASKVATLTTGHAYHVVLKAIGSTVSCTEDGTTVGSVTDTSITAAGKVGLNAGFGTGAVNDTHGMELDNFQAG